MAEAALADTLDAVAGSGADRWILALDGRPGPWLPAGFEVVPQRGDGLAERLAAAWQDAGGPGIQIGMDTPQVTAGILDAALARLDPTGRHALLGPASDGGWWAVGLPCATPEIFTGVPMSSPHTGRLQAERMRSFGWDVDLLDEMRDIDTVEDLDVVAAALPGSCLAATVATLALGARALTAALA